MGSHVWICRFKSSGEIITIPLSCMALVMHKSQCYTKEFGIVAPNLQMNLRLEEGGACLKGKAVAKLKTGL